MTQQEEDIFARKIREAYADYKTAEIDYVMNGGEDNRMAFEKRRAVWIELDKLAMELVRGTNKEH